MPFSRAKRYLQLASDRPKEFQNSETDPFEIIFDPKQVAEFEASNDMLIGLLEESSWNLFVRDLVTSADGPLLAFERIIHTNTNEEGCRGTVALLRCADGWLFNRQFRHATRATRGWEIESPRGYLEPDYTPEENIVKEIAEETGLGVDKCTYLGDFIPDTGLSGGIVKAYLCEILATGEELSHRLPPQNGLREGVEGFVFLDDTAFEKAIVSGEIRDGMTLSAWALLTARGKLQNQGGLS